MYLLSVIIPIYNAEPWLDECICSLLASVSDSLSSTEFILVNDGSTDNSGLLCDQYAATYPNFRVIHQSNGGVSSARNSGMSVASGRYFAWVDPDDHVSLDWFPAILDAIQRWSPDVIVMDSIRFGLGINQPEIYGRPGGFVDRDVFFADILRDIRIRSGLPNKVMKASLFHNVHFNTELPILEDFAAMPQILQSAQTVYYIPHCLYHYRQHESSLLHHTSAELAFQSVKIAVNRMESTDQKYQSPAAIATIWQAFSFLRTDALATLPFASSRQRSFCRALIRKNLWPLLCDSELSFSVKLKILLSLLRCYPLILRTFSKNR